MSAVYRELDAMFFHIANALSLGTLRRMADKERDLTRGGNAFEREIGWKRGTK